ncbi:MAG: GspE/PulE family protein [Oscillospiraceae bacterium]
MEYYIPGVSQCQINEKTGMTFAGGLRAILRQDPDIISVGEIRDGETASIAMRAAITGHLVLSTLHTNDAPSAVDRLRDVGVEPWLISGALRGIVVSQRLVRRICPHCKRAYHPASDELAPAGAGRRAGPCVLQGRGLPGLPSHRLHRPPRRVRDFDDRRAAAASSPPARARTSLPTRPAGMDSPPCATLPRPGAARRNDG